jgi:polyphosphate kinase 2
MALKKRVKKILKELKETSSDDTRKKLVEELENLLSKLGKKEGLAKIYTGGSIKKALRLVEYEEELRKLQIELIKLQNHIYETKQRVMVIFEGRDAAGKGGAIKRFTEHLNPRKYRVVALPAPTEVEKGQWYFQRYFKHLPDPGEIVFFDRSWYNRAIVEPVFGFCTQEEYRKFLQQVPEIESNLIDDGIILIKFWFSISKETQKKRFEERRRNPLKQWKLSAIDKKAQKMWDKITKYKEEMFSKTHTTYSPWIIVNSNNKKMARLESIRYLLSQIDYPGKEKAPVSLHPDPEIVSRYHRKNIQLD